MERTETETKDEALKLQTAIRCAKAALVVSSLKSSTNCRLETSINDEEKDITKSIISNLKAELARERVRNKKIKLCGLMEMILHITGALLLSSLFLMLAFKSQLD